MTLSLTMVSAGYRGRAILREVTIPAIAPGTILALVGPNGAGKSTVLKAIAGFLPVTGNIRLGDDDLAAMRPAARAGRIAYMPQALPRSVGLNVFEGVMSALRIAIRAGRTLPGQSAERRALAVLERLGILDLALANIDTLSGGQRQMAALAQALATDPAVLLLDEPTSALDLRHQDEFMRNVRATAASGAIVVVVLHELGLAARIADRLVVLSHGSVVADGDPQAAITPAVLETVWGVEASVERSARGTLHIEVTGPARSTKHEESP